MIATLAARVFDREGVMTTGGGMFGAIVSWDFSKVGTAAITILTIAILTIKLIKAIRDFKKPDKGD